MGSLPGGLTYLRSVRDGVIYLRYVQGRQTYLCSLPGRPTAVQDGQVYYPLIGRLTHSIQGGATVIQGG